VTLTFDLVTPKSIGVFYPIWAIILNIVGQMEVKLYSGNQITNGWTEGQNTPAYHFVRINSGHLKLKDNLPTKFEVTKPVHY
jgi:hypothetical protein